MKAAGDVWPALSKRVDLSVLYTVRVKSSRGGETYSVRLLGNGAFTCSCPGYYYNGHCKHADAERAVFYRLLEV